MPWFFIRFVGQMACMRSAVSTHTGGSRYLRGWPHCCTQGADMACLDSFLGRGPKSWNSPRSPKCGIRCPCLVCTLYTARMRCACKLGAKGGICVGHAAGRLSHGLCPSSTQVRRWMARLEQHGVARWGEEDYVVEPRVDGVPIRLLYA